MSRRVTAVVVGLAIVIIGGVAAFALTRGEEPAGPGTSASPRSDAPSPDSQASTGGTYVEYDEAAISSADGRVLLFFHAPWCPQCRSIEDDILADGIPAGITVIKVDYDSHQDLRQQYGVTLQTTFVEVDSEANELQKHVAYNEPRLAAVIEAMI